MNHGHFRGVEPKVYERPEQWPRREHEEPMPGEFRDVSPPTYMSQTDGEGELSFGIDAGMAISAGAGVAVVLALASLID